MNFRVVQRDGKHLVAFGATGQAGEREASPVEVILWNCLKKCDPIGAWLSAAMDDPSVCTEMKRDIETYFDGVWIVGDSPSGNDSTESKGTPELTRAHAGSDDGLGSGVISSTRNDPEPPYCADCSRYEDEGHSYYCDKRGGTMLASEAGMTSLKESVSQDDQKKTE